MTNTLKTKILILMSWWFLCAGTDAAHAQYPWPVEPKHQSQDITGTFCEFRDTGTSDHFHNGVDVPKADGSPVFAIANGTVTDIYPTGTDSYVRVGRYCYLHIVPNPSLDIGDAVVAEVTVLGTIRSGQGHIHFIDGNYGQEINAIRAGGGFTPYEDPWQPVIRFVKFFADGTEQEFTAGKVTGKVDIVVKVEEQNGPPGSDASRLNNGTYMLGYKILSADGDSIVYTPPNLGVRFRFGSKPDNRYVHNVFFKKYSTTSSHTYTVTNAVSANGYWDTSQYAAGPYTIMIFTEDTRQNADTTYIPVEVVRDDFLAPQTPVLKYIRQMGQGFQIAWYRNPEDDLLGYRLYYSYDNANWKLRYDENKLPPDSTTATFATSVANDIYFKLEAVNDAPIPNVSPGSDVYGVKMSDPSYKILVVDGFDRANDNGAWNQPSHSFAFAYGHAISENGYSFDCCSNDAVADSTISLSDYFVVIWFLGDEGEKDETFSPIEQRLVRAFSDQNGRLFISGTNVAWDLDMDSDCYSTTEEDNLFLNEIGRANYSAKIPLPEEVVGFPNSLFVGMEFSLNPQIYPADSVDSVVPILPATSALMDTAYLNSLGIVSDYQGGSSENAKLVYFTFPFELIEPASAQIDVMQRILSFFYVIDAVESRQNEGSIELPETFLLEQNYPNPFNASTRLKFYAPNSGVVNVTIYNVAGQKIRTVVNDRVSAGYHEAAWDGLNDAGEKMASGLYFIRLDAFGFQQVRKMILLE
ncbi:MAG: FlgD immunoglobulin-like domain containing protein [Candidatus Zhuqueibacterota bacterium]